MTDAGTTHSRSPLHAWAAPSNPYVGIALSRLLFQSVVSTLAIVVLVGCWLESSEARLHAENQHTSEP